MSEMTMGEDVAGAVAERLSVDDPMDDKSKSRWERADTDVVVDKRACSCATKWLGAVTAISAGGGATEKASAQEAKRNKSEAEVRRNIVVGFYSGTGMLEEWDRMCYSFSSVIIENETKQLKKSEVAGLADVRNVSRRK